MMRFIHKRKKRKLFHIFPWQKSAELNKKKILFFKFHLLFSFLGSLLLFWRGGLLFSSRLLLLWGSGLLLGGGLLLWASLLFLWSGLLLSGGGLLGWLLLSCLLLLGSSGFPCLFLGSGGLLLSSWAAFFFLAAAAFLALEALAAAAFFRRADSSGLILMDPFKPVPVAATRTPFSRRAFKLLLMAGLLVIPWASRAEMSFLVEAPDRDLRVVLRRFSMAGAIGAEAFLAAGFLAAFLGAAFAETTGATGAGAAGAVSDMMTF